MDCEDLFGGQEEAGTRSIALDEIPTGAAVKDVFVVMPFSPTPSMPGPNDWTETYEDVFKPAIEKAGYTCSRAEVTRGSLIGSIIEELRTARIVLADITDKNANVFYELGVRHALSKRTIIVTQNSDHIPSDLRDYWTIVYGRSPRQVKNFAADLARVIADIEANPERPDSPVGAALERDNANVLASIQRENAKKLTALLTELTGNMGMLQASHEDEDISSMLFTSCLDLLIQTLYVDLGPEPLKCAYEAMYSLKTIIARSGKVPEERRNKALVDMQSVLAAVVDAREKLIKGQFSEPTNISLLVWTMGPARFPSEGREQCNYVGRDETFLRRRSVNWLALPKVPESESPDLNSFLSNLKK